MTTNETGSQEIGQINSRGSILILPGLAIITVLFHIAVNLSGGYGYFRDELYYIACSDHLAWGYVDQPPFSILLLWISRLLLGDSLTAIRFLPAMVSGLTVYAAGRISREIGGGVFAQILAAVTVLVAPQVLGTGGVYSMNSIDIFLWTLTAWLYIRIVRWNARRDWIFAGIVLGIGLMNKISVLWLITGLVAGMIITIDRKYFREPYFWIAAGIAFFLFLPHCAWQVIHRLPTLEFIRNAGSQKYAAVSPVDLVLQFSLAVHPFTLPVWLTGLLAFLLGKRVRQYRALGIMVCTVFIILALNRTSKAEYLAPVFPTLAAAGALMIEGVTRRRNLMWSRTVMVALLIAGGAMTAPLAAPVLPVNSFLAYQQILGIQPGTTEKKEVGKLPQHFADMFGWEEMTRTVAGVYKTLTPSEQAECGILTNNYGEAGAIDFFGKKYNLPKSICGHNNYWYWGPRDVTGKVIIRLGGTIERIREAYPDVQLATIFHNEYCMPYENNLPIFICRGRPYPIEEDWPAFRHFE